MVRKFPGVGFERCVDGAVVHCVSEGTNQVQRIVMARQRLKD
jgi:hypothetical protein